MVVPPVNADQAAISEGSGVAGWLAMLLLYPSDISWSVRHSKRLHLTRETAQREVDSWIPELRGPAIAW